mmetsp:Transcript_139627/g.446780  ORF Transcript_139627/g.446780 Transcript_139627/m.446780 type:complete len:432 (-) Transcript_139627:77-1372(-)
MFAQKLKDRLPRLGVQRHLELACMPPHLRHAASVPGCGSRARGTMPLVTTAHSSVIEQPPFPLGSQELLDQRLSAQHKSVDIDPSLVDTFGRKHRYLRLSLTDKCNLRCSYCSPEEGEEPLVPAANGEALTADEISRLLRLFVTLGVRKVRLTGGEPTIRGDFGRIVKDLGELRRITDEPLSFGITTNGVRIARFLPQLRDAGLTNINLSLDTLVAAKFPLLVRRDMKWHTRVMDALHEMVADDSPFNVKLNCVLLRGVNEEELGAFIDLTEKLPIEVRFLEFMPFDGNAWSANRMVPQAEIMEAMQLHLASRGLGPARRLPPDSPNDVARLWAVDGWRGRVGVIASMTDAFCGGCNRLRITANGEMRNCLFGEEGWSLRDSFRQGESDQAVAEVIAGGVQAKFVKLGGKRDMHELRERGALALPMMSLGG